MQQHSCEIKGSFPCFLWHLTHSAAWTLFCLCIHSIRHTLFKWWWIPFLLWIPTSFNTEYINASAKGRSHFFVLPSKHHSFSVCFPLAVISVALKTIICEHFMSHNEFSQYHPGRCCRFQIASPTNPFQAPSKMNKMMKNKAIRKQWFSIIWHVVKK